MTPDTAASPRPDAVAAAFDQALRALYGIGEQLAGLARDAAQAPGRAGQAAALFTGNGELGSVTSVVGALLALLLAAALCAWLAWRGLDRQRRAVTEPRPAATLTFVAALGQGLVLDAVPCLTFSLIAAGGAFALFWDGGLLFVGSESFRAVASTVIGTVATAWMVLILLELPVAPGRPMLRLLPLDDPAATRVARTLRRMIALGAGGWIAASSLYLTWFGEGLPRLLLGAVGIAIGIALLDALRRLHRALRGFGRLWNLASALTVIALVVYWVGSLIGGAIPEFRQGVLPTLVVLAAVPAIDAMLGRLLDLLRASTVVLAAPRRLFVPMGEEALAETFSPPEPVASSEPGERDAVSFAGLAATAHEAAWWGLATSAAVLLLQIWSLDASSILGPPAARTLAGGMVDAALSLLVGWYAWRLFESGLAWRISRDGATGSSRAQTVRPLLRAVGKLTIGAVAAMSALSSLGLNIAPLLASAGIVGIAVGFGAQTLVKDLFSGAFYLIEDVFRIGDYIESGSAKGTVEKITIRTVALRHQSGPVQFVPYGSLGIVRNNSRDWVIDKFEIPLPLTVDSEAIRRMVKAIGQEMLKDPALAALIVTPLKAKLYRIQPGVKLFRCKVQTPPGQQFEVRSDALRRIEAALRAAGIPFADPATQVTIHQGGNPTPVAA